MTVRAIDPWVNISMGEHTNEIFEALGVGTEGLAALRERGVVA